MNKRRTTDTAISKKSQLKSEMWTKIKSLNIWTECTKKSSSSFCGNQIAEGGKKVRIQDYVELEDYKYSRKNNRYTIQENTEYVKCNDYYIWQMTIYEKLKMIKIKTNVFTGTLM